MKETGEDSPVYPDPEGGIGEQLEENNTSTECSLENIDKFLDGGKYSRQLRQEHPDYGTKEYFQDAFSLESLENASYQGLEKIGNGITFASRGITKVRDSIESGLNYVFSEKTSQYHANTLISSLPFTLTGIASLTAASYGLEGAELQSAASIASKYTVSLAVYGLMRVDSEGERYMEDGELQTYEISKDLVSGSISTGTAAGLYAFANYYLAAQFIGGGWAPWASSLLGEYISKPIYPIVSVTLGKATGYLDREDNVFIDWLVEKTSSFEDFNVVENAMDKVEDSLRSTYIGTAILVDKINEKKGDKSWTEWMKNSFSKNMIEPIYDGLSNVKELFKR